MPYLEELLSQSDKITLEFLQAARNMAISKCNSKALGLLLEVGAGVEYDDDKKMSLAHFTVQNDDPESLKVLIKHQAPIDKRNSERLTPIALLFSDREKLKNGRTMSKLLTGSTETFDSITTLNEESCITNTSIINEMCKHSLSNLKNRYPKKIHKKNAIMRFIILLMG